MLTQVLKFKIDNFDSLEIMRFQQISAIFDSSFYNNSRLTGIFQILMVASERYRSDPSELTVF